MATDTVVSNKYMYICVISLDEWPPYNWNTVESGIKHHNPNPL